MMVGRFGLEIFLRNDYRVEPGYLKQKFAVNQGKGGGVDAANALTESLTIPKSRV